MEFIKFQINSGHLFYRRLNVFGILVAVENTMRLHSCIRFCGRNEIKNGRMSEQRLIAPILGDERKKTILDFIPFTAYGYKP